MKEVRRHCLTPLLRSQSGPSRHSPPCGLTKLQPGTVQDLGGRLFSAALVVCAGIPAAKPTIPRAK
jgi:hypothetical protein